MSQTRPLEVHDGVQHDGAQLVLDVLERVKNDPLGQGQLLLLRVRLGRRRLRLERKVLHLVQPVVFVLFHIAPERIGLTLLALLGRPNCGVDPRAPSENVPGDVRRALVQQRGLLVDYLAGREGLVEARALRVLVPQVLLELSGNFGVAAALLPVLLLQFEWVKCEVPLGRDDGEAAGLPVGCGLRRQVQLLELDLFVALRDAEDANPDVRLVADQPHPHLVQGLLLQLRPPWFLLPRLVLRLAAFLPVLEIQAAKLLRMPT